MEPIFEAVNGDNAFENIIAEIRKYPVVENVNNPFG